MKIPVIQQLAAPSLAKVPMLRSVSPTPVLAMPSARQFPMHQQRTGDDHAFPSSARQPQAQIDIPQLDGEVLFVKSTYLVELVLLDGEASASNRCDFARRPQHAERAGVVARAPLSRCAA